MKKTTLFLIITALCGCASNGEPQGTAMGDVSVNKKAIANDLHAINSNKKIAAYFEKKEIKINKKDNLEQVFFDNGIPPSSLFKLKDSELSTIKMIEDGDTFIITQSAKYKLFKIEKIRGDKLIFAKTMIGEFNNKTRIAAIKNKKVNIDSDSGDSLYGFVSSGDLINDCSRNKCESKTAALLDLLDGHSEFGGFRRGDKLRFVVKKNKIEAIDFISKNNRIIAFWENGDGDYVYFSDAINKKTTRRVIDSDAAISPVYYTRISSRFNPSRFHPVLKKTRAHNGVDLAAKHGSPIMTVYQGRVSFIGERGGYGKMMLIDHGKGLETAYGHMSRYNSRLKVGDYVGQGDLIGYVGSTGLATGPHLHYEVRVNHVPVDPTKVSLSAFFKMKGFYQERSNVVITQNIKNLMTELNSIRITN